MNAEVTYGWLIQSIASGSPAESAGLRGGNQRAQIAGNNVILGGDIIIAIDGVRMANGDDALAYLERYTSPSQTINITIIRNSQSMDIVVTLSARTSSST
jgi:S1-C subfamily serine protease